MADGNHLLPLGPSGRDRTLALARAVAGMVPIAGSLIAELITEVVPGQRLERAEDWLRHLTERLTGVEEAVLRERLRKPENVALFEEGVYQAARAFSEERRRQIAELVAGGIADDRRNQLESHRVLRLLGELDDAEVIILAGYLQKNRESDYWERHGNVVQGLAVNKQSSRDGLDVATVREAGRQHLVRLGLLDQGTLGGAASIQLNGLGRLLLRRIGLADENDW
jgi:hypothetical protein